MWVIENGHTGTIHKYLNFIRCNFFKNICRYADCYLE